MTSIHDLIQFNPVLLLIKTQKNTKKKHKKQNGGWNRNKNLGGKKIQVTLIDGTMEGEMDANIASSRCKHCVINYFILF